MSETDKTLARDAGRKNSARRSGPRPTTSDMPTFTVAAARVKEVLRYLKTEASPRFLRLEDLTAVDESTRRERPDYPDYTLVYHLLCL